MPCLLASFKMGELKKLVEEGKIKYVGLSEACASTIRRAHSVHPITAVQNEWSLWSRDLEEEIVPTCRPLGCSFFSAGPKLIQNLFTRDFQGSRERILKRTRKYSIVLLNGGKKSLYSISTGIGLGSSPRRRCESGTTKMANFNDNIGAVNVN
ncbi:hypothetical protein RD792_010554 [Penstemon davidsonii]|uniref:NADP-dependent oxidoreductase domain-containing protein n=1 Tax=Penstemon davidsonii TaxID=160366 RepID=A0ABR0D439_9LAMI|nr:hypothetical protein RD792_010554 [Penstemon davidsonii]